MSETVNHPQHYGGDTPYEVIKVLIAWGLDEDFFLGNTVKYVARAGKKSQQTEIEDLEKAQWYLEKKIELLKSRVPVKAVVGDVAQTEASAQLTSTTESTTARARQPIGFSA